MSPGTRRGAPGQEPLNVAVTAKRQQAQGTTPLLQQYPATPRHVLAETHVVAGRVRSRLLMLVACDCGALHVHYGPLTMTSAVRQAACGRRYIVHTTTVLGEVAA